MAFQTRRTKKELKQECRELGILDNVDTDKRVYKDDYIKVLRTYYLNDKYNNNPPISLELLNENLVSPMLACRYKKLNEKQQKEIWESSSWCFEEKSDGVRLLVSHIKEEGMNFYSRNISVDDFLPISYRDTIHLGDSFDYSKIKDDFIIDTEITSKVDKVNTIVDGKGVITKTQLQAVQSLLSLEPEKSIPIQKDINPFQFITFDCVYWNGEWLYDRPLKKRREFLIKAILQLKEAGLDCKTPKRSFNNKKEFYRELIENGGEGVIAKNTNYKYIPNTYRRKEGWVKIKRNLSHLDDLDIGDTIDAWVSGYKRGTKGKQWEKYVGALEFSVMLRNKEDNKIHTIAVVSGIPDNLREAMTEYNDEGEPILKEEFYNKVAELDGMNISARKRRLKHARIIRWRPDKSSDDCFLDEEWLEKMIL